LFLCVVTWKKTRESHVVSSHLRDLTASPARLNPVCKESLASLVYTSPLDMPSWKHKAILGVVFTVFWFQQVAERYSFMANPNERDKCLTDYFLAKKRK